MISINLNYNGILNIRDVDCCCNIYGISKNFTINLLQNANLTIKKKKNLVKVKKVLSNKIWVRNYDVW